MIFQLTSSANLIGKIYRDFNVTISQEHAFALEWIHEAIQSIGAFAPMQFKSTGDPGEESQAYVENHRVKIPCDLESVLAIEYKGSRLPLGNDKTLFSLPCNERTTNQSTAQSILPEQYAGLSKAAANIISNINNMAFTGSGDYYQINLPYIVTSFEEGYIKIHYNAYPLDDNGFPLIPDHYYYMTALSYYILWKMFSRGNLHPTISKNEAYQMWTHYKELAKTKAKVLTADQRERMKRRWLSLIPEVNAWVDFGMNDHNPQEIAP